MTSKWLSVKEIADSMGLHPRTVQRLLIRGELQGHKFGNQWRVPLRSFEAYLNKTSNVQVGGDDPEPGQTRFEVVSDESE